MLVCFEELWEAWSPPVCPQFPDLLGRALASLTSRICPAQGPTILFTLMNQRPVWSLRKHLAHLPELQPTDDLWPSFPIAWRTALLPQALFTWASCPMITGGGIILGGCVAQWTDYLQRVDLLFWSFWSQHLAQGTPDPRTICGKREERTEGRKLPQKSCRLQLKSRSL